MLLLVLAFTFVLAVAHQLGHLSMAIVIGYGAMSTLTFILYAVDKHAAITGERRIPELHLHLCALLGGWPGALLAQPLLRHKRRKMRFQIGFWGVTAVNAGVLMMWIMNG